MFKNYKNLIFFQKIPFFKKMKFFKENKNFAKKKQTIPIVLPKRIIFNQSSPVHPVSESRGGYRERDEQTKDGNPRV